MAVSPQSVSVYRNCRMDLRDLASDTPLAMVDPGDLRRVWHFTRAVQETAKAAEQPGSVGIDIRLIEKECQPGTDVMAVFFRAALIPGLFDQGLLDEWREGNEPGDAVFTVAAAFPLEGGVQGFNLDAFKAAIERK